MLNIYQKIAEIEKEGKTAIIITVTRAEGHTPSRVGSKLVIDSNGNSFGTVGGGSLEEMAREKALELLKSGQNVQLTYSLSDESCSVADEETKMICGGTVTLFFECLEPGVPLYLFGCGHVGQNLIRVLDGAGYRITAVDCRQEISDFMKELALFDFQILPYETALATELSGAKQKGAFVVIAAHSHAEDFKLLRRIFSEDWKPAYIGLLASKRKKAEFLTRLEDELAGDQDFGELYTPVGLDIGGRTPREIAIAIAAEMQMVRYRHGGGHLREK